jgi:RHS repeat-associated protein
VTDARGRTTELWQYHAATPTGTADKTRYEYNPAGQLTKLTDAAGNQWNYTYDQHGNQLTADDPDKGSSTSHYDDRDQLTDTLDAKNNKITNIYDGLGRQTETHDGDASGPLLTKHVWDPTGFKGQLASSSRYVGGASGYAYTTTYSLYDTLYRPHRSTTTVPASEGSLAGSYQTNVQYNLDGTVQSTSYPAAGGLATEVITPTYDDALRVKTLVGTGGSTYLTDAVYSYTGKPLQYTYQATGSKKTQVTNSYEWGTQRLKNSNVTREDVPGTDKSATYGYDEAGNITSISDVSRDGTDNQCFTYDYLARLTEAWAQNTATCASTPSATVLGGPATYWQSYTYDASGNRKTETQHDVTGVASKDVKSDYSYPPAGGDGSHSLGQVDTTGPTGISQATYTYDKVGNTETRTLAGDKQTFVWDSEGHLATVTKPDGNGGTKTTSYIYDADGNRLVTHTDAGTTLYLGNTEVTLAKGSTTPKGTRYYDLGGGNQAIRTNDNKLSFLIADQNGTAQLAVNAADLTVQERRSTPFGEARGTAPTSWPGEKGFIGGTEDDTTGVVHLGARDYDPTTGRFLSVDPVLDLKDPQQFNAYTYSNSSPVTRSDPSGQESGGPDSNLSQQTIEFENRNDGKPKGGKKGAGKKSGGNGGGTGGEGSGADGTGSVPVGISADGQPMVNGIRIPPFKELNTYAAIYEKNDTYAFRIHKWVLAECTSPSGPMGKMVGFCKTAGKAGLLGGDENDPFGIKANIHCFTGHGDCTEAIIGDVLVVVSWGAGKLAASAAFAAMATKEGLASAKILRAIGFICSFSPDTRVLLKSGHTKAIEKIKPGDQVEAADPRTGRHVGARRVAARLVHQDSDLVDLMIRDSNGKSATLHTTANHPFWDDTKQEWTPAGELNRGDALNTQSAQHARVVRIVHQRGEKAMYNLTIQQLHTYYVLAGTTPILVHNAAATCKMSNAIGKLADGRFGNILTKMYPTSTIESQFKIWTPYGYREADYALEDGAGGYQLYEVKANGSRYTAIQKKKDAWIAKNLGWETAVIRMNQPCPVGC